jgi:hypothetical protein
MKFISLLFFNLIHTKLNNEIIRKPIYIYPNKITISYNLTNEQLKYINNIICDNFYSLSTNDYININLYQATIDKKINYYSYVSLLVKNKYINIYGEYILMHLESLFIQNKKQFIFKSTNFNISFIIDNNDKYEYDKYNISFLYNHNTTYIYHTEQLKTIKKYYIFNSTSNISLYNISLDNPDKIVYTKNDNMFNILL